MVTFLYCQALPVILPKALPPKWELSSAVFSCRVLLSLIKVYLPNEIVLRVSPENGDRNESVFNEFCCVQPFSTWPTAMTYHSRLTEESMVQKDSFAHDQIYTMLCVIPKLKCCFYGFCFVVFNSNSVFQMSHNLCRHTSENLLGVLPRDIELASLLTPHSPAIFMVMSSKDISLNFEQGQEML